MLIKIKNKEKIVSLNDYIDNYKKDIYGDFKNRKINEDPQIYHHNPHPLRDHDIILNLLKKINDPIIFDLIDKNSMMIMDIFGTQVLIIPKTTINIVLENIHE